MSRFRIALAGLAAAAGLLIPAGLAGAATTAPASARAAATPAYTSVTIAGVPSRCYKPGTRWAVRQSGISIRQSPGGKFVAGIAKGAVFLSRGPSDQAGVTCISLATPDGTAWAFGVAKSSRVHGWVGRKWLKQTGRGSGY